VQKLLTALPVELSLNLVSELCRQTVKVTEIWFVHMFIFNFFE